MMGFTYNGTHSSTFGLYYAPDESDLWFNDPEYDVYDMDVSWRHGGYYFDSKVKNRTFTLKCYFEEIDVATRQRIKEWVKRDTSGELIFDDMPFVYWHVHPGKAPIGKWYLDTAESHSGTVTLSFIAYEPFGYLMRKSNGDSDHDNASDYCNMINTSDMPAAPTTSSTAFDIYNPGTEDCGLSIEISGTASNPIRFYNETNDTYCSFGSLPTNNLHVRIDGDTGYVSVGSNNENGYAYHDKGVVRLSPNRGYSAMSYTYGGINGTLYVIIPDDVIVDDTMVGAKITISGVSETTFTVVNVNKLANKLNCSREGSGTPPNEGTCKMIQTNHIVIEEKSSTTWTTPSTLSLNSISVDYNPRAL